MPPPSNHSKPIEANMPFQELTSLLSHPTLYSQVAEHGLGNAHIKPDKSRVVAIFKSLIRGSAEILRA